MEKRKTPVELTVKIDKPQRQISTDADDDQLRTMANTIHDTAAEAVAHQLHGEKRTTIEIPGYRILHKLGQGGMGSVHLAIDEKLGRQVAIKVISHAALDSEKSLSRFNAEIQTVASLQHANIVQLYSAGDKDGIPFFVMEFVDGMTLDQWIGASPLEPRAAAELVRTLALTIQHCHDQGIVHRDLKPSNVLMAKNSVPKITDFGLAKAFAHDDSATRSGEILGTPSYMAPEQAAGKTKLIGPATDVYGLGAIFYFLLTGRPPFAAPNAIQTISQVISDDPISPRKLQKSVPLDLDTICMKCLSKGTDRRYETAAALASDMQRYLNEEPIHARPVGRFERVLKWTRRRPALAALIALVALAIPLAFAGLTWHTSRLTAALKRESLALSQRDAELEKSVRLAEKGSELSDWLSRQHMSQLNQLMGTTEVRHAINQRITEYLEQSTPDMPQTAKFIRRFGRAWFGLAMSSGVENQPGLGDTTKATELIEKALEHYDRALLLDPADQKTKNLKIQALLSLANQHDALGNAAESRDLIDQAQATFDSNAGDTSTDRRLMRYFLLEARFEQQLARQEIKLALATLDRMKLAITDGDEDPLDPEEVLHQEIRIAMSRGKLLIQDGEFESARNELERAKDLAEKAYQKEPGNPIFLDRYAKSITELGDVFAHLGKPADALKLHLLALELRHKYADWNPKNSFSKYNLANAMSRVETTYSQVGQMDKQLEFAKRTAELNREMAAENPRELSFQRNFAISLSSLGFALTGEKEFEQASAILDEANEISSQLIEQQNALPDLGLHAEIQHNRGYLKFSQLMENVEFAEGKVSEQADFVSAIEFYDLALETFERMRELGELNYQQESIQANVVKVRDLLLDYAKQMESSSGAEEIQ